MHLTETINLISTLSLLQHPLAVTEFRKYENEIIDLSIMADLRPLSLLGPLVLACRAITQ